MRFFDAINEGSVPVILADSIVEPFEQFLDYTLFTVKIETHPLVGRCGRKNQLREEENIRGLSRLSQTFKSSCAESSNVQLCITHAISKKIAALVQVRPWLTSPRGFTSLFLLELVCRSQGNAVSHCNLQWSAQTAQKASYW